MRLLVQNFGGLFQPWQWGRRVLQAAEPHFPLSCSCALFLQPAAVRGRSGRVPEEKSHSKCSGCACSCCCCGASHSSLLHSVPAFRGQKMKAGRCSVLTWWHRRGISVCRMERVSRSWELLPAGDGWWCRHHFGLNISYFHALNSLNLISWRSPNILLSQKNPNRLKALPVKTKNPALLKKTKLLSLTNPIN